jgi:hypothetical protein
VVKCEDRRVARGVAAFVVFDEREADERETAGVIALAEELPRVNA